MADVHSRERLKQRPPRGDGLQSPQISLRSIFHVTLVASVLFAVLAPLLRSWNSGQRYVLIGIALGQIAVASIAFIVCWRWRRKTLDRAGDLLFRTTYRERRIHWARDMWSVGSFVFVLAYQLFVIHTLTRGGAIIRLLPMLSPQTIFLVQAAQRYWSIVWGVDEKDIELCENGLIYGAYSFRAWTDIYEARPSELRDNAIVLVAKASARPESKLKTTSQLIVAADLRDELARRITEQLATASDAHAVPFDDVKGD